eukprot:jgi/Mesen1/4924/ME000246S04150
MAANFFKWQADPFFEAAEDIQDSADRLESSSRKWLRAMAGGRKQMGLLPEESISIKHLITACSTVKWQLEEFERAIEEAAEGEYVPGSGTLDRRKQFIEALRGQIRDVEEDIYDCREAASAGVGVAVVVVVKPRLGLANGAPVKESEDEGEEMKDLLGLRSVIRRSVHRSHVAVMQRGPLFVATMGLLVLGMIGLLAFCRGARGMSSST